MRQMEKEAKDVFGKYMSALNNTNQDDENDIVHILELKMEALRIAETDVWLYIYVHFTLFYFFLDIFLYLYLCMCSWNRRITK